MNGEILLTYVGTDFWSRPVFRVNDMDAYIKDLNCGEGEPDLTWSCPKNDPDGEPDYAFKTNKKITILNYDQKKEKTRQEKKLILAKMIAANEYVDGKHSVEWIDFVSSIKDLDLTKRLLSELKEEPIEMTWEPGKGWSPLNQQDMIVGS